MPFLHKLPPVENVGASQTAIAARLPMGQTYHAILFKLGGTAFTKAHITAIRCRLDGKQFVSITGAQLDKLNQYDGRTDDAAYLTLPFGEMNARTLIGEGIGSIETTNNRSFDIEVDIGGATAPTLEMWAILGGLKADRRYARYIRSYLTAVHSPAAAGEFNLPIPVGSRVGNEIKRVNFFDTYITKIQVRRDGLNLMQEAEVALLDYMYSELSRVAQSGHVAFDPAFTDNQSDAIPTYRADGSPASFEWLTTVSQADTVTSVTEVYAPSIAHV